MNDGKLTAAQKRARDWLPQDGSWRIHPGRLVAALNSLSLAWAGCVEMQRGPFGPRGGHVDRWRLTAKGVEVNRAVRNAT